MAISGRQLRFRRWLSCDLVGYCEIATSACGLLAMTNLLTLRHRIRAAKPTACKAVTDRRYRRNRLVRIYRKLVPIVNAVPGGACPSPTRRVRTNRQCLPEIAPQGHFLALRAQGATSLRSSQ